MPISGDMERCDRGREVPARLEGGGGVHGTGRRLLELTRVDVDVADSSEDDDDADGYS